MQVDWMILGEGIAQDAQGSWTIVSIGQDVLGTAQLPAQTKRAVLTHVSDVPPGRRLRFTYRLIAPSGKVLASQDGEFSVGETPIPDVPASGVDIPADFRMSLPEFGTHRIVFELTDDEDRITVEQQVVLHVIDADRLSEMMRTAGAERDVRNT